MKIDDAKAYFETDAEIARQAGLARPSSVCNWRREGRDLIPELYARRIYEKVKGRRRNGIVLKFDRSAYE